MQKINSICNKIKCVEIYATVCKTNENRGDTQRMSNTREVAEVIQIETLWNARNACLKIKLLFLLPKLPSSKMLNLSACYAQYIYNIDH